MPNDIDALRAQVAQAEAKAKAAEAEAARAQAEALKAALAQAEAASSHDSRGTIGEEPPPMTHPAEGGSTPDEPGAAEEPGTVETTQASPSRTSGDFATTLADAYNFDVPCMVLGTIMEGSTPSPPAATRMPLGMFNRHMLVAGATGTGKTRTLQLLAEGLSTAGSSVLLCDVKGDLTGLAVPGVANEKLLSRTQANGQDWSAASFPVEVLKLGEGTQTPGIPVRVSVSDFGPILLARALDLNTTQEQSLSLIFSWADSNGLELVDLGDLRAVINFLTSAEGKEQLKGIGGVSTSTAGVILRAVSALQSQGGDEFFGVPGFDPDDLIRNVEGKGIISLLQVGDISSRPALVSAVIMWLLASLFSALPEVGDLPTPKLVFFFDEAHLLFSNATKEFLRQVVQTVRLIRSKGVGIVFVTQTPKDIPADVLAQLGSKVQHALRAATPDDHKKLTQTVATFPKTELDLARVLTSLGTGEAVVTVLNPDGQPTPVAPTKLWAPASVMGPADPQVVTSLLSGSPLTAKYQDSYNPESAEEKLAAQAEAAEQALEQARAAEAAQKEHARLLAEAEKARAAAEKQAERAEREAAKAAQKEVERQQREAERAAQRRQKTIETALNSVVRTMGSGLGKSISRSIFGTRR